MRPGALNKYFGDIFEIEENRVEGGNTAHIVRAVARKGYQGLKAGAIVAMKSPKSSLSPNTKKRFKREAEVLEQLMKRENPYVIQYYGCLESPDKVPVLLLEWADSDLQELRGDKHPDGIPPGLQDRIIERICKGLLAVHNLKGKEGDGYLHRDIKPSNILIFEGGLCKIGDFGSVGICTSDPNLGKSGSSYGGYGTDNYNAPECLRTSMKAKRIYSVRSDIYSVGLIALYLITGCTPWEKEGLEDIRDLYGAKTEGKGFGGYIEKSLESMLAGKNVPQNKVNAIKKAISGDPIKRQGSIEEFLTEYQIPTPQTNPLQPSYEEIKRMLSANYNTPHGAAPIEIVDAALNIYEDKMLTYQKDKGIESSLVNDALKLIKQRGKADSKRIEEYAEKAKRGKIEFPTDPTERRIAAYHLVRLVHCWGNEYADYWVIDEKNRFRADQESQLKSKHPWMSGI